MSPSLFASCMYTVCKYFIYILPTMSQFIVIRLLIQCGMYRSTFCLRLTSPLTSTVELRMLSVRGGNMSLFSRNPITRLMVEDYITCEINVQPRRRLPSHKQLIDWSLRDKPPAPTCENQRQNVSAGATQLICGSTNGSTIWAVLFHSNFIFWWWGTFCLNNKMQQVQDVHGKTRCVFMLQLDVCNMMIFWIWKFYLSGELQRMRYFT